MRGRIAGDFTHDDAAAVCLYTLELDKKKYEMSPYDLLNRALRAEKNVVKEIVEVRDVLFLVMVITRGVQGPSSLLTTQKAPSLSSGEMVVAEGLFVSLIG